MQLSDVREFLRGLEPKFSSYFIGKLDSKKDNSLGIYNTKGNNLPNVSIGGFEATKTYLKRVSLLIHGTKNNVETEKLATDFYKSLLRADVSSFQNYKVSFIALLCDGPIPLGNDDNGACEYSVDLEIYYQKEE